MNKLNKLLLIGAGGFGVAWRDAILANDCKVVGVVDINKKALKDAQDFFGLKNEQLYDPTDLWESCGADIVIDCSPFHFHYQNTERAFKKNMHVLTVKPLAEKKETALKMVSLVDQYKRKGMVAQQKRYYPVYMRLRELMKQKVIGQVENVSVNLYLSGLGWEPGFEWRSKLSQPTLYEAAIHHFDIFQSVFQIPLKKVFCHSSNPSWSPFEGDSTIYALLENEEGMTIQYNATFAPRHKNFTFFDSGWELEGTDGVIKINNGKIFINEKEDIEMEESPPLEDLNKIVLRQFLEYCYNSEEEHELSYRNNLKGLLPIFACEESIKKEAWVKVAN